MKPSLHFTFIIIIIIVLLFFVFYSEIIINKYSSFFDLLTSNTSKISYKTISKTNETPNKDKYTSTWVPKIQTTKKIPYINEVKLISLKHSFIGGVLKNDNKLLKIYIHHSSDLISRSIIQSGSWELHLVNPFIEYIKLNPGIQVLDAGSNLGVYTLIAASLGCRVVAVDANIENTNRLAQSLVVNSLTMNVTLLLNALSNQRNEFILLNLSSNIGGQYVIESKTDPNRVKAIFMDDLIPLFQKKKPIIIKMDIECKEIDALSKATKFFDELNVTLLVIEWNGIKKYDNIGSLMLFLIKHKFSPYLGYNSVGPLLLKDYKNWPVDVVWIKKEYKYEE